MVLVNIPDFDIPIQDSVWALLLPNAAVTDANANVIQTTLIGMRGRRSTIPVFEETLLRDGTKRYDKFSPDSTLVLKFSETVQAGTGHVRLTAAVDSRSSMKVDIGRRQEVDFVGTYVLIAPQGGWMPGETYTPSFAKGVVAGSTGALGRNESAVAPFTVAVQQRWSQTDRNVGVVLDELEALGHHTDTVVLFIGGACVAWPACLPTAPAHLSPLHI